MSKRRGNRRGDPGRASKPPKQRRDVFVRRPFAGLADEPDWVALRELVPAATAPLSLAPALVAEYGDRPVTLATLLPMAAPAMTRRDGSVLVAAQRDGHSGDLGRDLAAATLAALATEPGKPVDVPGDPGEGPRLTDILVDGPLEVAVHDGFEFWLGSGDDDPAVAASLERANGSIIPTIRLTSARAAYWCQMPERAHLRWVLAEPEEVALPALARVSAGRGMKLGEQTRFAGMFRAHGLLIPVWDLPRETPAEQWEAPLAEFGQRYREALAVDGELTADQRRARQGLIGRQLTLR